MVPDVVYFNCDLPSTVRALADPELFLGSLRRGAVVALDEVHRLADPSLTLKIAADEYPHRPKCYAFDTGFVTFERGWNRIREDDRGILWEHLVLDSLRFRHLEDDIFYWRDKSGREVDFVVRRGEGRLDTFECKIDPDEVRPAPVVAFRKRYPLGRDHIVVPTRKQAYRIRKGGRVFTVCGTRGLGAARPPRQGLYT